MAGRPQDRHRDRIDSVGASLLEGPGHVDPSTRRAAARNEDVPEPYATFVDTIHRHAYRVTDGMVSGVRSAGASEDEVFEMTLSAAYGAALERYEAGIRALVEVADGTSDESPADPATKEPG